MDSIWEKSVNRINFPLMDGDTKTDVLIIGGGIAGILCAHFLQRHGVDYILVEADRICGGITGKTTAKITFQHGLIYNKLMRIYGEEYAKMYLSANRDALDEYKKMCEKIKCNFSLADNYIYSLDNKEKIEAECKALQNLGTDARFCLDTELPFKIAGAVKVTEQACFHPLAFLYSVASGLNIKECTKVTELVPGKAKTNRGEIQYKYMICATHFPFINKHGLYFAKMYQHRSYSIALKNAPAINGMYMDEDKKGFSFRGAEDMLILGGSGHRTGKNCGGWNELNDMALRFYPGSQVVARWATQDCITLDDVPYIGLYSKNTPEMYVTTGFNKWGMTSAMAAAMLLTDMVIGKSNPYSVVFAPNRSILHPRLFSHLFSTVSSLLTPAAPRCPHLGCALKYNKQEHSWDCSCHGSRFSEDGKLLDTPAQGDLPKK